MTRNEILIRSFVRNAYLMSSLKELKEATADSIASGDDIKARFLQEMIAECKAANVKNFCDLPF
jgi:hypothetical protein